ncbi:MAG TPA: ABC transporter permease [Dehalococcoidales bacterium]|nr:ABC transporter permease [Dehalococcoidales bacterium]
MSPTILDPKLSSFEAPPRINEFKRFIRVFFGRPVVIFGFVVLVLFFIAAAIPGLLTPFSPVEDNLKNRLLSPGEQGHLLGTDALGRDMLTRIIYGARTALLVGVVALSMSAVIGMLLGLIAGYFGGLAYVIIMRFIDALMTFPPILLALTIAAMLGGGLFNVMIAIGIGMMPGYARVMCGQAISIRENDYVMAARSLGASHLRIMFRHILPHCLPPMIVLMTMMIGMTILAEAGLSFLGVGVVPPTPAWGSMVYEGYNYLLTDPLLSFIPGMIIMIVVFAFNMVGDGLRDAIDPRLRGTI